MSTSESHEVDAECGMMLFMAALLNTTIQLG